MLEIDVNSISYPDPLFWVIRDYDYAGFLHPFPMMHGILRRNTILLLPHLKTGVGFTGYW